MSRSVYEATRPRRALLPILGIALALALPFAPSQALAFTSSYSVETVEYDGLYVQLPLGKTPILFVGDKPVYLGGFAEGASEGKVGIFGFVPSDYYDQDSYRDNGQEVYVFTYRASETEADQQDLVDNPADYLIRFAQDRAPQSGGNLSNPVELEGNADSIHQITAPYTDESGNQQVYVALCIEDKSHAWLFEAACSPDALSAIEGIACSASTDETKARNTNPLADYIESGSLNYMDGWFDELGNVETEGVQFRIPEQLSYDRASDSNWDYWSTSDNSIGIGIVSWSCDIASDPSADEFAAYLNDSYKSQTYLVPTFLEQPRAFEINGLVTYVAHYEDEVGEGYHIDVLTPTGKVLDLNCFYAWGATDTVGLGEVVLELVSTLQAIE